MSIKIGFPWKFLFVAPLLFGFLPGCAVDNEFLAKMPLFEAKSDRIPGLQPPLERKKLIRLKGEKGAKAAESEKEIIVAQLMVEYRTSPDRNMRREAVDAMAKIPHPKRDQYMKEILADDDPFVRISALEALGERYSGPTTELAAILVESMKRDPDTDVRLAALRLLGTSIPWQSKKMELKTIIPIDSETQKLALDALADSLYDKVPAIRYETMQVLGNVTGKDFGSDINRWVQYVQHTRGEAVEMPKERSLAEKMPKIQLPMLK